jgi:hypothetical protein
MLTQENSCGKTATHATQLLKSRPDAEEQTTASTDGMIGQ